MATPRALTVCIAHCTCQLIAECIREYSTHPLTENQVRVLLVFAQSDLDDTRRQTVAFGVLRAIILRKVLVPELYDVMDRVTHLLVQSKDGACRTLARQARCALAPLPCVVLLATSRVKITRACPIPHALLKSTLREPIFCRPGALFCCLGAFWPFPRPRR